MRNIGVALAVGGAVLAAGCQLRIDDGYYYEDGYYADDGWTSPQPGAWSPPVEYFSASSIDVRDAHLAGQLGNVRFRDELVLQTGESYPGTSTVSLHAGYVDWAVMTQLTIQGGLGHEALVPGAILHFDQLQYDPSGLAISVLGCAGTSPGTWDVDQNASSVDVRITEAATPGNRVLSFIAVFDAGFGRQTVAGSFEYSPDQVAAAAAAQPTWDPPTYEEPGTVMVDQGTVRGDLGSVEGFSGDAWLQQAYGSPGYTSVELQTQGSGWATMALLSFEGGIDHGALTPGAHLEFDLQSYGLTYDGTSSLFVTVVGCSGDQPNDWSFDQTATSVTIDVSAGSTPDRVRIDFTARFDYAGRTQVITGSFEVSRGTTTLR